MKEQIKIPEKQLSDKEIDNLSDAEFKTVVIRILTELIELSHKMKEEMKAIQSEIKENIQGTNSEGKKIESQVNDLEQKGRNKHSTEKELRNKNSNNKEKLRNLWDNFKHSSIQIIGVSKGEEQE